VDKLFDILFLEEAFQFLNSLDKNHREKIFYNIRRAQVERDPALLKKLTGDIWEFRTLFMGLQYRLLAFWDKTGGQETLIISTHGFIKKQSKVPEKEMEKAKQLRIKYFEDKKKPQKKTK
jgi:phage-related protein